MSRQSEAASPCQNVDWGHRLTFMTAASNEATALGPTKWTTDHATS